MASTHKHIRSGTANKRPTTAIAEGQIALATNITSPGLFFKDSTGATIVKIGPVHVGATAPNVSPAGSAGNSIGEVWLDTSLTPVGVKIWDGSAFVNATPIGSTTVQGLLELATDAETQAGADTARAVTSASLQSKLSDSTSTTSNTTIASSTAVKAAYDLANAALPKTGGTVTGNLEIGTAGSLSFEGATADGFETTIAITDPTADRTITLPNITGTVVTTGDSGTVTSTMILDGTIVDADINASAEISVSKLVDGSARQLLQTDAAGTGVEWASNIDIPGTLDVTSAATFDSTVTIAGDLTVNGTTTNINTVNLTVEDKNIIIGDVATPTDITADGGGITLKGTTDKTINWVNATDAWTFSEHVNIASAKEYQIAGTKVLDATSLGSAVVSSSLTSVGTIGTGVWQGTAITDTYLATIATAGKVSNSATTATSASTASAIVARDASGNFTAGTITAALTGAASSNVLKAGDTMTGALVVPLASASTPSLTFTGDLDTGVFSPGANQVAVATSGTGRLFVASDGNVGIGTASPGSTLSVTSSDQVALFSSINAIAYLRATATTNDTAFGADSTGGFFAVVNSAPLLFKTGNTERLRITSTGALNFVGAGTAGSTQAVSFNGSAPVNSLVIDSSGLVGIGTSSPTYLLQATGTIASVNSFGNFAALQAAGGTGFRWTLNNDGTFRLQRTLDGFANASVPIFIDSSDRVGIGTTSPSALLHIKGTNSGTAGQIEGSATADYTFLQVFNPSGIQAQLTANGNVDAQLRIVSNHPLSFYTNNTEKARIDSSGRLLVGASTARANLYNSTATAQHQSEIANSTAIEYLGIRNSTDLFGGTIALVKSRGTTVGSNTIVQSGDQCGVVSFQGSDGTEFIESAKIECQVDGTPGANDMPGRLVFSTTADGAAAPTERMRISQDGIVSCTHSTANQVVLNAENTNASYTSAVIRARTTRAAGTDCFYIYAEANSVNTFIVHNNGNVHNTNNSYAGLSDIKLKENIVDATSQWSDIKALQVRKYNFKEETGQETHTQIGLVAQEVELVSPGLVSESPDRDEEGNDLGTVTKSVNYSVLYMKAVKALQEAMERIEALEAKVTALEGA